MQDQLLGRLQSGDPDAAAVVRFPFLHEGIVRAFLSRIGERAGDAAVYWKYGCWFYETESGGQALVKSDLPAADAASREGTVSVEAWGRAADELVEKLLQPLLAIPVGHKPEVNRKGRRPDPVPRRDADPEPLRIGPPPVGADPVGKQVFISYAWGDKTTEEGRKYEEHIATLFAKLREWGYEPVWDKDKDRLRPGDLISEFMKIAGEVPRVVAVIGDKYLRSEACMTELYEVYRKGGLNPVRFLARVVPVVMPGANIYSIRGRCEHGERWQAEHDALAPYAGRGKMAQKDYARFQQMAAWAAAVPEMLSLVADTLHPVGFDALVAAGFADLRAMLERRSLR